MIITLTETSTAKDILEAIDKWAYEAASYTQAAALWDILSAIRGPDEPEKDPSDLKYMTTAVIRYKAFPHLSAYNALCNKVNSLDDASLYNRNNHKSHFSSHITSAIIALKEMGR